MGNNYISVGNTTISVANTANSSNVVDGTINISSTCVNVNSNVSGTNVDHFSTSVLGATEQLISALTSGVQVTKNTTSNLWSYTVTPINGSSPFTHTIEIRNPKVSAMNTAQTFDFYISTTGSDSANGSLAAPWAITSLQATNSNNVKMVGKRIGLIAGTYNLTGMQSSSNPGNYQYSVLAPPYGSNTTHPTYIGSSDITGHESLRAATISWTDSIPWNGTNGGLANCGGGLIGPEYFNSGASRGYLTINGLIIDAGNTTAGHVIQVFSDYGNGGAYQTTAVTAPVEVWVMNCEIRNIKATDNGNNDALIFYRGVNGNSGNGAGVINNYLHDVWKNTQADHAHAYEEYASQGILVAFNTIARCTSSIESKGGSSGTNVCYNYITSAQWGAITGFDGGTGNPNSPNTTYTIHHNVLDNNGTGNSVTSGTPNSPAFIGDQRVGAGLGITQATTYYNNTIFDPRALSSSVQLVWLVMSGTTFINSLYNNIIHVANNTGTSSGGIINGIVGIGSYNGTISGPLSNLDYNCYDLNTFGLGFNSSLSSSLSGWKTLTGAESHSVSGDPGYIGTIITGHGPNQFQLNANSICFGTAQGGINMGAWDGVISRIGCDFAPATP